jgi:hypothetical protein
MMPITNEQAMGKTCPNTQLRCQGHNCMAWVHEMRTKLVREAVDDHDAPGRKVMHDVPVDEPTGRGVCAIVPHVQVKVLENP